MRRSAVTAVGASLILPLRLKDKLPAERQHRRRKSSGQSVAGSLGWPSDRLVPRLVRQRAPYISPTGCVHAHSYSGGEACKRDDDVPEKAISLSLFYIFPMTVTQSPSNDTEPSTPFPSRPSAEQRQHPISLNGQLLSPLDAATDDVWMMVVELNTPLCQTMDDQIMEMSDA